MLKRFLLIPTLFCTSYCMAAESAEYNKYMKQVSTVEINLAKCIPDVNESPICYTDAEKSYDNIIKNIRKKYSSKVDLKLWQTINLGYEKRKKSCRSSYLDAGPTQLFYPYVDCLNTVSHALAITTIELHLK